MEKEGLDEEEINRVQMEGKGDGSAEEGRMNGN
jgi:hypothetical protein